MGDRIRVRLSADAFDRLNAISTANDSGLSVVASLILEAALLGVSLDLADDIPTLFAIRRQAGLVMKPAVRP